MFRAYRNRPQCETKSAVKAVDKGAILKPLRNMAKGDEIAVAALIGREVGVKFSGRKFPLPRWGQVDDWAKLQANRYLFLEIETSQKHPCTNVLKVWPYLVDNPDVAVILAQAFFQNSRCSKSSRAQLGSWLGQQLETTLTGRFRYHQLRISGDKTQVTEGLEELHRSVALWKST